VEAPYNKSLDASGGSIFVNLLFASQIVDNCHADHY